MTDHRAEYRGAEIVELVPGDGQSFRGGQAEGDLCRWLIGEGHDPAGTIGFHRDGKPALRGSGAAFARATYDADLRRRPWRPHPNSRYPQALLAWHGLSTCPVAAKNGVQFSAGPADPPDPETA